MGEHAASPPRDGGEYPRTKVTGGVDGVPGLPAESDTDGEHELGRRLGEDEEEEEAKKVGRRGKRRKEKGQWDHIIYT